MASKWADAAKAALEARFLSQPRANSANSANRSGTDRDDGTRGREKGAFGTNGTIGTPRREREAPSIHRESEGKKSFSYASRTNSADSHPVGGWTAEDWRIYYLERAAIREYDGHLSRQEADRRAWRETANRWWHEHGSRSAPGLCAGCGRPVALADAIPLPHE